MPNDVNYYWRVRVHSGTSISEWTDIRSFIKQWYIKPVLLTPVNLYQHVRFPIFNWTPVPGASYYKVEIDSEPNFSAPIYDSGTTANTFFSPTKYSSPSSTYYWRVTPYDGNGEAGVPSNTSSYVSYGTSVAPQQIYPFYYYPPDTYSGFPGITTNPTKTEACHCRSLSGIALPSLDANQGQVYAQAYRLQVSTDPTFNSFNWQVDTENLVTTPWAANPFAPVANTIYYWRVRPLIGGVEIRAVESDMEERFDPTRGLAPVGGAIPTLIRPTTGFEFADRLLCWNGSQ